MLNNSNRFLNGQVLLSIDYPWEEGVSKNGSHEESQAYLQLCAQNVSPPKSNLVYSIGSIQEHPSSLLETGHFEQPTLEQGGHLDSRWGSTEQTRFIWDSPSEVP